MNIRHLHFGGGSPTVLEAADFARLVARLKERFAFAAGAEIAVELDPRTADEDYVAAMAKAGVTRASVGVQDFDPTVQEAIHRVQPFEQVARVVGWLRAAGIAGINVDLLYGLPHQSETGLLSTIDKTLELAPDRISLFGYAHVPWMKKHQTLIPEDALPGVAERWSQYEAAHEHLIGRGYVAIGLDHFARADDDMTKALGEGRLHRNFQGYTTDAAPVLLGLGASGIGALPQGYVANEGDIAGWRRLVAEGTLPIKRGVALSDEDRLRRAVIERLMCELSVDPAALAEAAGRSADHFAAEFASLADLEADGVVIRDGSKLSVTDDGRPLVRAVAARFDQYLRAGEQRHSKAV